MRNIVIERSVQQAGGRDKYHTKRLVKQKSMLIAETKKLINLFILSDLLRYKSAGGVFSDSFGIILGLQFVNATDRKLEEPSASGKSVLDRIDPLKSFSEYRVHYLVDSIWPIIRYAQFNKHSERHFGKPEYSLSLLQRRRVLYVSALGRITPTYDNYSDLQASDSTVTVDPTIYFMFPMYRNRWQLGRVVEQMHNLSTWRVASVRSLYGLALSSRQIVEIGRDISAGIYKSRDKEAELKHRFDSIGTQEFKLKVRGSGNKRSKAAEIKKVKTNYIDGNIQYRIERSKYYYENFIGETRRLAIDRVEGFPPYDEFVGRRLNETHQFIESVGELYNKLEERMRLELNYYRYKQSEVMQKRIDDNTKLAVHFLENAENVLFIPLTYYAGSTIHYLSESIPLIGKILDRIDPAKYIIPSSILNHEWVINSEHTTTIAEYIKSETWSEPLSHFIGSVAMLFGFVWAWVKLRKLKKSNLKLEEDIQNEITQNDSDIDTI